MVNRCWPEPEPGDSDSAWSPGRRPSLATLTRQMQHLAALFAELAQQQGALRAELREIAEDVHALVADNAVLYEEQAEHRERLLRLYSRVLGVTSEDVETEEVADDAE
jgi:regulator of replication initiation timing|tara:strand:- start:46 stop:369 length:324 start_codon:yes stop_codon:yes gene_type:complete